MPTPLPGMDPYLERRGLREEIHTDLISRIKPITSVEYQVKQRQAERDAACLCFTPILLPGKERTTARIGASSVPT